ncbi:MAG TPA: Wadjet anti-phage system protein JetD domain-containing protein [Parafilimonas sp.]|nr:Wadjet anti-phage system protein JetD domain-containing protein [Parafilimonas sp.]
MITPKEIQEQCSKWWKEVLLSSVNSITFFPKEITRIGKISSKDILNKLSAYKQSIELLINHSKRNKKLGYTLLATEKQFDKIGKQLVPEKILIDSIEDYLQLTGKEKEYNIFSKNLLLIQNELPQLTEWIKANPVKLIEHNTWVDTLKVCKYFLQHPKPNLYIRQLPIDVHTKYINENKGVITSLLNYLIPYDLNHEEKDFEKRFNLLSKEQLIRIRFLDVAKSPLQNVTDISFTERELKHYNFTIDNVFIAENLMNFLTLPLLKNTIAIWSGGGFNISYLKNIEWLKAKQFFYWGDIDAQGFQILNQCRNYFSNTKAVMMDMATLIRFPQGEGKPANNQKLQFLSEDELSLYNYLREKNIRLEQEKITQDYADNTILNLFKPLGENKIL